MHVLLPLLDGGGPCSVRELAEAAAIASPTATRTLDGLERDGLVIRRPSETDRRSVLVELTDEGRAQAEAARKVARASRLELYRRLEAGRARGGRAHPAPPGRDPPRHVGRRGGAGGEPRPIREVLRQVGRRGGAGGEPSVIRELLRQVGRAARRGGPCRWRLRQLLGEVDDRAGTCRARSSALTWSCSSARERVGGARTRRAARPPRGPPSRARRRARRRRRLGHRRVGDQRRLDLEGPDPVAGGDDHVVGAALEVEVAVVVGVRPGRRCARAGRGRRRGSPR